MYIASAIAAKELVISLAISLAISTILCLYLFNPVYETTCLETTRQEKEISL